MYLGSVDRPPLFGRVKAFEGRVRADAAPAAGAPPAGANELAGSIALVNVGAVADIRLRSRIASIAGLEAAAGWDGDGAIEWNGAVALRQRGGEGEESGDDDLELHLECGSSGSGVCVCVCVCC
jgi:hypothetical protein